MKLSKRLTAIASLVHEGYVLADVGTDHAYIPIYLLEQKKIPRAIAMDINRGPLQRANEHIALYGMGGYIQTRLSDGVDALDSEEADSILIAGMGGSLIMHILDKGMEICKNAKELVLQPQSEVECVRAYLRKHGFVTEAEDMIEEDGKYYNMMRVHRDENSSGRGNSDQQLFDLYGGLLLKNRHPVLLEYIKKEERLYRGIHHKLCSQNKNSGIEQRIEDVEQILNLNHKAMSYFN